MAVARGPSAGHQRQLGCAVRVAAGHRRRAGSAWARGRRLSLPSERPADSRYPPTPPAGAGWASAPAHQRGGVGNSRTRSHFLWLLALDFARCTLVLGAFGRWRLSRRTADAPAPKALFDGFAGFLLLSLGPLLEEVCFRAATDLAGMAEDRVDFGLPVIGDVDRVVGFGRAGEQDFVHLVRFEAIVFVVLVEEPIAHDWVDSIHRGDAHVAVVTVVEAAAEAVPRDHHIRFVDAKEAHDLPTELRILAGETVGVAEEDAFF